MTITRRKAALRRAEGLPSSPQNQDELPRELRPPQPRKKKTTRSTRSTRSTVTPDSEEDLALQQHQKAPAQALREGNAGGYIRESSCEQQDFLPEPYRHETGAHSRLVDNAQERSGAHGAATAAQNTSGGVPVEPVSTPPSSPSHPNSSPPVSVQTTVSIFRNTLSEELSSPGVVHHFRSPQERAAAAASVSTKTDRQLAAQANPVTLSPYFGHPQSSVATAATQTSPFVTRKPSKHTELSARTSSVQTEASPDRFRTLSLYSFRSELAVPPDYCTITLHLGNEREIRVSDVSAAVLDEIKAILDDPMHYLERNWLTSEEAAAESAAAAAIAAQEAEKQPHSSAKRKRDDENDGTPVAQRRRIDPASSPTPLPFLTPNPFKLRSRLRKKGSSAGQTQTAATPMRSVAPVNEAPATAHPSIRYGRDGGLRLLGGTFGNYQQKKSIDEGHAAANGTSEHDSLAVAAATEDDSDDEGESEPILEWPEGPYWSAKPKSTDQAVSAPSPPSASSNPLSGTRHVQDTDSASPEQVPDHELPEHTTQTPQPSGWRFGSLLNTARRFIPSIRRQPLPTAPQTIRPTVRIQDMVERSVADEPQRGIQTEPRQSDQQAHRVSTESTSNFAQRLRDSKSATQRSFRSKETVEEMKKVRAEKEKLQAEWAKLEEERRITEQERKDVEDAHRAAYASEQPGSKRPRRPSPRVIPNPKGVSYGLDPAYFDSDSSDEENEEAVQTPTRTRPMRKARRIEGPDHQTSEEGSLFSKSVRSTSSDQALQYHGSRFSDSPPNAFELSAVRSKVKEQSFQASESSSTGGDASFNYSGHFAVPDSPTSSEEDQDESREDSEEVPSVEQHVSTQSDKAIDNGPKSSIFGAYSSNRTAPPIVSGPPRLPQHILATPDQTPRAVRFATEVDPSKTLEQKRQALRGQMELLQGRKSVPSPQDIANSPRKIQPVKQPSLAPASRLSTPASMQQSQKTAPTKQQLPVEPDAPVDKDDFSIRGASGHLSSEAESYLFLQTIPPEISNLHAFNDFQSKMYPNVKEYLESSWQPSDDTESVSNFESAFEVFTAPDKPGVEAVDGHHAGNQGSTAADKPLVHPQEDETLFLSDNSSKDQVDANAAKISSLAKLSAAHELSLDPSVAAFLESRWTPEDEAYASDEFKGNWASFIRSQNFGQGISSVTA